jgi:hypothetical protein
VHYIAAASLARGINTTKAIALISGFSAVVVAAVGFTVLLLALGSKGTPMRKVAEKVIIVVVGVSMIAACLVIAKVSIFSGIF